MIWMRYLKPYRDEQVEFSKSLDISLSMKKSWAGVNARPKFTGLVQIKTLDEKLVPVGTKGEGRLIVIGDIHGCKDDCMSLVLLWHYV